MTSTNLTITEIAMKYQYNSPETFTRAFKKLWEVTPSEFKNQWRFTRIFPKITGIGYYNLSNGGREMIKKVDISDVYDALKAKANTWVCCFDIQGLVPINNISYEAGDKAILETAHRIEASCTSEMLLFRIGGDEFALVTGLTDQEEAEELAQSILSKNNQTFTCNGQDIPLALRVGMLRMPEKESNLRYQELFTNMHQAINDTRDKNSDLHIYSDN
jgi:AraC family transcriptional regulator